jgi:hypothetical protein
LDSVLEISLSVKVPGTPGQPDPGRDAQAHEQQLQMHRASGLAAVQGEWIEAIAKFALGTE